MSPDVVSALNASAELFENFCITLEELYSQKYSVRRDEDVDNSNSTFCWTLKLEIPGGIQLTKPFYISFTSVEVKEVVSCVLDYMGGVIDLCESGVAAGILPDLHANTSSNNI